MVPQVEEWGGSENRLISSKTLINPLTGRHPTIWLFVHSSSGRNYDGFSTFAWLQVLLCLNYTVDLVYVLYS